MQETNFSFEVIVHDDASTDGTTDIIKEYASKYPLIIRPIYEEKNQFSINNHIIQRKMESASRGKYIAWCEGDDFWIDPKKLQKQVDFLEANPQYALCHHNMFYEKNGIRTLRIDDDIPQTQTIVELAYHNYIQTATVVFRKPAYKIVPDSMINKRTLAHFKIMRVCEQGDVYYMNEPMSVYRLHDGGIFSKKSLFEQFKMTANNISAMAAYYCDKNTQVMQALQDRLKVIYYDYLKASVKSLDVSGICKMIKYYKDRKSKI